MRQIGNQERGTETKIETSMNEASRGKEGKADKEIDRKMIIRNNCMCVCICGRWEMVLQILAPSLFLLISLPEHDNLFSHPMFLCRVPVSLFLRDRLPRRRQMSAGGFNTLPGSEIGGSMPWSLMLL